MAYSTISSAGRAEQHGFLAPLKERFAAYRRYRTTLAELQALNSRELADIGLTRDQIRDVARGSVYRDL